MEAVHKSVLLNEVLQFLQPEKANSLLIDSTLGEGGHTKAFLEKYGDLQVVGLDADKQIQERAKERLAAFEPRVKFVLTWFDDFYSNYPMDLPSPDLILFDLGISVFHYELAQRGFSFGDEEKLDMRLSENSDTTAADLVNNMDETSLANLIYNYSGERYSRRIAGAIVSRRQKEPFSTAVDLANVIAKAVPGEYRRLRLNPATKTFQALRIAVNDELTRLPRALEAAFKVLKLNGKMAVITFHSLEDRIVKNFFRDKAKRCICPPEMPICKCRGVPEVEILTGKAVAPTELEIRENSPSRSAKLRVVRKIYEEKKEN